MCAIRLYCIGLGPRSIVERERQQLAEKIAEERAVSVINEIHCDGESIFCNVQRAEREGLKTKNLHWDVLSAAEVSRQHSPLNYSYLYHCRFEGPCSTLRQHGEQLHSWLYAPTHASEEEATVDQVGHITGIRY